MARHLFGAKPLSEPMLAYCYLDHWEQISMKFNPNKTIFVKMSLKISSAKWRPFCLGPSVLETKVELITFGQYSKTLLTYFNTEGINRHGMVFKCLSNYSQWVNSFAGSFLGCRLKYWLILSFWRYWSCVDCWMLWLNYLKSYWMMKPKVVLPTTLTHTRHWSLLKYVKKKKKCLRNYKLSIFSAL